MKIAVVTHKWHGELGGVEKYNRSLYKNFPKSTFTEFPLFYFPNAITKYKNVSIDNSLNNEKRSGQIWLRAYSKKRMRRIFNDFDLVIFSATAPARKWIKNDKAIVIQHMDKYWYFMKQKNVSDKIAKLFSWIFGIDTITNTLKRSKNVFYYSKETSFSIKNQNAFYAPLTSEITEIDGNRHGAMWTGRINKEHKNIPELIKVMNSVHDFEMYGSGKDQQYVMQNLRDASQYRGHIDPSLVDKKLQTKRTFVMTSNYEGFSYSIVEALSNGCAVCMYDTFDACEFFKKCESVFLFEKNDTQSLINKINEIEKLNSKEFSKLSKASTNFSKSHLSNKVFVSEWRKLIK